MHTPKREDDHDTSSLMQGLGADFGAHDSQSSDRSRTDASMTISDTSSGPPPLGPQPNRDTTWHEAGHRVRSHVTDYSRSVGRRQLGPNQYVQSLGLSRGPN